MAPNIHFLHAMFEQHRVLNQMPYTLQHSTILDWYAHFACCTSVALHSQKGSQYDTNLLVNEKFAVTWKTGALSRSDCVELWHGSARQSLLMQHNIQQNIINVGV